MVALLARACEYLPRFSDLYALCTAAIPFVHGSAAPMVVWTGPSHTDTHEFGNSAAAALVLLAASSNGTDGGMFGGTARATRSPSWYGHTTAMRLAPTAVPKLYDCCSERLSVSVVALVSGSTIGE